MGRLETLDKDGLPKGFKKEEFFNLPAFFPAYDRNEVDQVVDEV